jgi:hypothetical protein
MSTLADKSQLQASAIMRGKHKLAGIHQEILDSYTKQFGVRALDFYCERREASKGSSQMVHVILESVDDVKKIQAHRAEKGLIAEQFLKCFKSAATNNSTSDPLKSDVFPGDTNPFPEIIVTYRPLTEVDRKIVNEMLDADVRTLLKTFESVWTMSMSVIFYYTDAQIKENQTNGTSTKVLDDMEQLYKKYEFDFDRNSYRFDSKEIFDRDYESKWHYYWK